MKNFLKKSAIVVAAAVLMFSLLGALGVENGTVSAGGAAVQESSGGDHGSESGHADPVAPVLVWIVVVLLAAKLGGELFEKFKQPAVLGELVFGVIVGNMHLIGINWFVPIGTDIHVDILSRLGVIILLFMVGLESNIKEMMKVGVPSLMVAIVGVVVPFLLGFFVSKLFFPLGDLNMHLFIGATLTATSVGITARVFKDLGKLKMPEAKIILGAAVIDDVMGLIVLAVVTGIITTGSLSLLSVGLITFKSVAFLIGAIVIGTYAAPMVGRKISKMNVEGMKIITALIIAFVLSWAANLIGLATIVGAFAAGLILDDVYFKNCTRKNHHNEIQPEMHIEDLIRPIAQFLVPIFFVLMGIQGDSRKAGLRVGGQKGLFPAGDRTRNGSARRGRVDLCGYRKRLGSCGRRCFFSYCDHGDCHDSGHSYRAEDRFGQEKRRQRCRRPEAGRESLLKISDKSAAPSRAFIFS